MGNARFPIKEIHTLFLYIFMEFFIYPFSVRVQVNFEKSINGFLKTIRKYIKQFHGFNNFPF